MPPDGTLAGPRLASTFEEAAQPRGPRKNTSPPLSSTSLIAFAFAIDSPRPSQARPLRSTTAGLKRMAPASALCPLVSGLRGDGGARHAVGIRARSHLSSTLSRCRRCSGQDSMLIRSDSRGRCAVNGGAGEDGASQNSPPVGVIREAMSDGGQSSASSLVLASDPPTSLQPIRSRSPSSCAAAADVVPYHPTRRSAQATNDSVGRGSAADESSWAPKRTSMGGGRRLFACTSSPWAETCLSSFRSCCRLVSSWTSKRTRGAGSLPAHRRRLRSCELYYAGPRGLDDANAVEIGGGGLAGAGEVSTIQKNGNAAHVEVVRRQPPTTPPAAPNTVPCRRRPRRIAGPWALQMAMVADFSIAVDRKVRMARMPSKWKGGGWRGGCCCTKRNSRRYRRSEPATASTLSLSLPIPTRSPSSCAAAVAPAAPSDFGQVVPYRSAPVQACPCTPPSTTNDARGEGLWASKGAGMGGIDVVNEARVVEGAGIRRMWHVVGGG
ncbi:hypothetical protein BJ912DRAFT_1060266 [Pholiota molesta]|nr:hypothetical protein BJ912DRAFT_1060266 [Pholiota molesta]